MDNPYLSITFRDHLLQSIKTHLRNILTTLGKTMFPGVESIDVMVSVIANDNVELACAFIQKKAVEKVKKHFMLHYLLNEQYC